MAKKRYVLLTYSLDAEVYLSAFKMQALRLLPLMIFGMK